MGPERILMGSDWPHAEGLADPVRYIDDLKRAGYDDATCRRVMRDNGFELATRLV
jgi:predicted TIM-barrel fold metal-dependent hydrolase